MSVVETVKSDGSRIKSCFHMKLCDLEEAVSPLWALVPSPVEGGGMGKWQMLSEIPSKLNFGVQAILKP